jgi:N-glycosylase/DNA lyase
VAARGISAAALTAKIESKNVLFNVRLLNTVLWLAGRSQGYPFESPP